MEEMLQIRMQFESSSTGGVLLYAVGPEGSKGAGDGHFVHGGGRPKETTEVLLRTVRDEDRFLTKPESMEGGDHAG
jgi:hypothetical protein